MADTPKLPIVIFQTGNTDVQVTLDQSQDTLWISQKQISELFGRDRSVITKYVKNIYNEDELAPDATSANFAQV